MLASLPIANILDHYALPSVDDVDVPDYVALIRDHAILSDSDTRLSRYGALAFAYDACIRARRADIRP